MHDRKQKELALHEQTQEWKTLETQLNIEPVTFPEQGIDRYESAKIQTQNLKRDIGLREERLTHLKSENEKINVPKQSDIDAFNHIQQQENKIDKETNQTEMDALEKDIVSDENYEKKKQYNNRVFELQEKNNLYQKMKEAFDKEQQENARKQNIFRFAFVILAVVGVGLTIFSFISANLVFGIVFALLSLVFIVGIFLVKSKEI